MVVGWLMPAMDRPEADLDPVLIAKVWVVASAGTAALMSGDSDSDSVPIALHIPPQMTSSACCMLILAQTSGSLQLAKLAQCQHVDLSQQGA